ncbi:hypothetical protein K2F40_13040 [Clostridium sp. CM028]|uniref:urease accessory protein UreH domain-containing protein n=1 Tax=unclassified Clostridium TaxID=2614128 RepID=UPI001C0CF04A|nr:MULTISPECIES: hypothetical protein [unclassified Clostridium]MBU3092389.1 hypothetical protein [Clostridium sp. CF011]MBW9149884.1 hypothetical protein [Clostridium sp. CM028]WAG68400.1 hypothetical protein LL036_09800 [Clostridium sp. CF011]WLC63219.1 hypothetical protein KTC94_08230 [Clostridium sp. CM028]
MRSMNINKVVKRYCRILFLLIIFFAINFLMVDTIHAKTNELNLIYFNVPLCNTCNKFEDELNKLQKEHKNIKIYKYDISKSQNYEMLVRYNNEYKLNKETGGAPIIFVSDRYIKEPSEIKSIIREILQNENEKVKETPILEGIQINANSFNYDILGFIFTGFINGLNPCSISMLLFFLSLISVKNVGIKKLGFSFILGKFIAYLLIGSVLYTYLSKINIGIYNTIMKEIFILFSAIIIYLNVNDFLKARKEKFGQIKNQLPRKVRRFNHNVIKRFLENKSGKILVIISFLLGVVISLGEFLCTGQVYLASISYMIQKNSIYSLKAFSYLFLYDLVFIIPPIIIVFIIDKGTDMFKVSSFLVEKMYLIKLLTAIVMFLFCLFIVFII